MMIQNRLLKMLRVMAGHAGTIVLVIAMILPTGQDLSAQDSPGEARYQDLSGYEPHTESHGAEGQDHTAPGPNPEVQDQDIRNLNSQESTDRILADYLVIASENNPGLRARFGEYQAALERVPQVGALPNPEMGFSYYIRPMEFPMGNQRAEITLMQMFPWFGTPGAREDAASRMALARYEEFLDAKNRLYYEVKSVWYELYELENEIEIMNENLQLLRELEELALMRFQSPGQNTGGGGMSDVLRVRMEINELENVVSLLVDSRIPLTARFNQLLNRPSAEKINIPGSLDIIELTETEQANLYTMIKENPMVRMLDEEAGAYEVQERIAGLEGRPSIGIGLNYMIFSEPHGGSASMDSRNMLMPMVTMTLPVFRERYKAQEREARLSRQTALSSRENMVNELSVELSAGIRDLSDAARRTDLYRRQTDLADKALDILMTEYAAGLVRFEEVLRLQEQLLDYRLEFLRAVADHNRHVARLDMLSASELSGTRN